MLNERGLTVETYDSIKYHYTEIEYPLAELREFFTGVPSDIVSPKAARVYADALQGSFSELMDNAQEIDEEYLSGKPEQFESGLNVDLASPW